jgi:hypothetical protein
VAKKPLAKPANKSAKSSLAGGRRKKRTETFAIYLYRVLK